MQMCFLYWWIFGKKIVRWKKNWVIIFFISDDVFPHKIEPKGNYSVYIAWSNIFNLFIKLTFIADANFNINNFKILNIISFDKVILYK